MSNQRVVSFAYFLLAIIALVVLQQLFAQLWMQFQWPDRQLFGQIGYPWMAALVITAIGMVVMLRNERVNPFLLEVVGELKAVTWPTRQETASHTMVVIVTVLILSLVLGVFDAVWAKVTRFLLNPNF